MGPISYAEDEDGKLLPLVLCKEQYKKSSKESVADVYDIDSEVETGEKGRTVSLQGYSTFRPGHLLP